jgi:hypothetical protein
MAFPPHIDPSATVTRAHAGPLGIDLGDVRNDRRLVRSKVLAKTPAGSPVRFPQRSSTHSRSGRTRSTPIRPGICLICVSSYAEQLSGTQWRMLFPVLRSGITLAPCGLMQLLGKAN